MTSIAIKLNLLIITSILAFQPAYSPINKEEKNTNSTGTNKTVSFEPVYFILGTLSDYMGRFQYVDRNKQVDRYYPFEKPLVDYLTKYIKKELNIVVDTVFEKSHHSKMFSDELSKTLNNFYGENDELLNNRFETKSQIYSFLAGVYYRYGEKIDSSIYKIQLANSPKHQNCYEFLKQIGCEKIFYKYLRNIPAQFILYFEASSELKKYLDSIERERVILKKSFNKQIKEMMTKKGITKEFQELKDKEAEKIKEAFKI